MASGLFERERWLGSNRPATDETARGSRIRRRPGWTRSSRDAGQLLRGRCLRRAGREVPAAAADPSGVGDSSVAGVQGKPVAMRIVRSLGALAVLAALWLAIGASAASAAAVINTIPVGTHPYGVSSDGTHVWVANVDDGTVSEIAASTGTVVKTITVGSGPHGVSSDGTHVWVTNYGDGTVSEIDSSTGTVVKTITVGSGPYAVSSDGTDVWVANYAASVDLNGDGTVSELDASTGTVVATITVGINPNAVSSDGVHVWVVNGSGGGVSEIDASTGTVVKTITVGNGADGVSSDGTDVWVTNGGDGTVSEIDAATGTVAKTITVGNGPEGVSSDGTHVWVTNVGAGDCTTNGNGTVSEIDASTGTVVATITVGTVPFEVSSDGTAAWVSNYCDDTVSEVAISGTLNHTLTVTRAGTGSGTVTSSPSGISCGSNCTASFSSGSHVTLTEAPATGSTFAGWSGGGCSGTSTTCQVTLSSNQAVTATFKTTSTAEPTLRLGAAPRTSGTHVILKLTCAAPAGQSCNTIEKLTLTETLLGHKPIAVSSAAKKRRVRLVVGKKLLKLGAGKTATLTVGLDAKGRALLRRFGKLPVRLTVSITRNGHPTAVAQRHLTLKGKKRTKK